jgi:hypothetical protein
MLLLLLLLQLQLWLNRQHASPFLCKRGIGADAFYACIIFAQVELAQTEYQLPRLTRMWSHLDRVALSLPLQAHALALTLVLRFPSQVELAQTEYQLPRLTRMWSHLDRVAGGGQVKGTGEKQIEIDKRLLRDKAAALRRYACNM